MNEGKRERGSVRSRVDADGKRQWRAAAVHRVTAVGTDDGPSVLTLMVDRISSSKGLAQMDWPPLPVPVGSPVWIINDLMLR